MLEADSHAKFRLRKQVRGLRAIEREVLAEQAAASAPLSAGDAAAAAVIAAPPADVVLDYCAAVRGILNDDQGGPLQPPGERMAEALGEVRQSLHQNLGAKKGGPRRSASPAWPAASTPACKR